MRILLIITLAFALSLSFTERAYLPEQKDLQVTGGFVDGFKLENEDGQAFLGGITL